jgi:hypothetical protein
VVWAKHNCPGSWNDGDISLELQQSLLDTNLFPDQRYGLASDSAFPCSNEMRGRIITPMKKGDIEKNHPSLRSGARAAHNAITSIRQAAEWGVGSLEKVYKRLLIPLPYNPKLRAKRLENITRLCNFRVRSMGISQIRTVFNERSIDV